MNGGLLQSLKRVLGFRTDSHSQNAAQEQPSLQKENASSNPALGADFLKRLNQIHGEQRSILSGKIQLVGLEKIRDRLGPDWPRNAEKAQVIANHCIRRSLSADDIYVRYDELRFLIVFANLSREQAQVKCLRIAEEIGQRLLGEDFDASATQVETGVFESDGSLVFSALNKSDLISRLEGAGAPSSASTSEPSTTAQTQPAPPLPQPPTPDFSIARIDKAKALSLIRIDYRPMWSLKQKAITTYFASTTAVSVFGRSLRDDEVRQEFASVVSTLEFDSFVTRSALSGLTEALSHGSRMMLCWSIDFETIATRQTRHDYLAICQEIPEPIRKLLILEINHLPIGVPQSRLVEVIINLRTYCRAIFIRVPPDFRRCAAIAASGAFAAGFSLNTGGTEEEKIRHINEFAEQCTKFGLRSYIRGVPSRAQVLAALAAGIDYIDGPAVAKPSELPGAMRRFEIDEIYR
ncbi:MAG: hypothetical protein J0H39_11155 [Alphaproteobacteria bacterium]|nr:hypothetical protein [Alphaproteobacteria bacterium]